MIRRVFRPGRVCAIQRALNSNLSYLKNSIIYKFVVADPGLRTSEIIPIFENKLILIPPLLKGGIRGIFGIAGGEKPFTIFKEFHTIQQRFVLHKFIYSNSSFNHLTNYHLTKHRRYYAQSLG